MSVNKKNRSLWGSRSEAQRIYYQRQTIKRLEKENNQLKENNQAMQEEMCKTWEKLNIIKELRNWLEDEIINSKAGGSQYYWFGRVLSKLNELEGGKNE